MLAGYTARIRVTVILLGDVCAADAALDQVVVGVSTCLDRR